jgi:ABC-type multidrug transport system ATPase subunit
MNCIIGLLTPSNGKVFANLRPGFTVETTKPSMLPLYRQYLGVCPQFDILFENLSVQEHLEIYFQLKGVELEQHHTKTDYLAAVAKDVELSGKVDQRVSNLSGGMKRKLSVGIALLGSPRIIILDEPASGMDVAAQHHLWSLIKKVKRDRTVLMTTHSMEEAEVLGDRLAVMSKGKIQAQGTTQFLKSQYGVGYSLEVFFHGTVKENAIVPFVQKFFPGIYH